VAFDSMGPGWTTVRENARTQTLRKQDPEVAAVAARWDDLVRYLALDLTKDLGRDVKQVLSRAERAPGARRHALIESLANSGQLEAELQVPDAAGPLNIVADLRSRQVIVSTKLDAPREGRAKVRVSWLLRQLSNAPDGVTVEARVPYSAASLGARLSAVRESPDLLYPDGGREIREFRLSLSGNMGLKRDSGRGSFVESVIATTKDFYSAVLQNLRPWKAAPPKLPQAAEEAVEVEALPEPLQEAVTAAESEMDKAAGEADGGESDNELPTAGRGLTQVPD